MSTKSSFLLWLAYGIAFFALGYMALKNLVLALPGIDDAYIFFVYARNFAEGHGFVYNVGGERVEGFSSMLWTLVLSAVWKLFGQFSWELMGLCVAFSSLCLVLGIHLLKRLTLLSGHIDKSPPGDYWKIICLWMGVWALASPGFVIWSTTTLMENCLWELLLMGSVFWVLLLIHSKPLAQKELIGLGGLLGLLVLCRPEGMYWVCLLLLGLGVGRWCCGQTLPNGIRDSLIAGAVCALILAALVGFRLNYFGYPLPNTYYAKVSPDRWYNIMEGVKYLVGFGKWHWGVPICCIAVWFGFQAGVKVIWLRLQQGKTGERGVVTLGVLCAFLIGGLIVAPLVGGDHFAMYRIFQVFWVLLPIPLFIWLWKQYTLFTGTKKTGILLLGVLLGLSCRESWFSLSPQSRIASEYRIVEKDTQIGQLLNDWFSQAQAPSIGVLSAGAIAFEYHGVVWDLMGLNFSDMAHSPGDKKGQKNHAAFNKDIFWQVTPDIFLPYISTGVQEIIEGRKKQKAKSIATPESDPFKGLRRDPRFIEEYALGVLSKADSPLLGGVFHRSYLKQLQGFQFQEVPLD